MVGATECRDRSALSSHLVGPTARVLARDDGPRQLLPPKRPDLICGTRRPAPLVEPRAVLCHLRALRRRRMPFAGGRLLALLSGAPHLSSTQSFRLYAISRSGARSSTSLKAAKNGLALIALMGLSPRRSIMRKVPAAMCGCSPARSSEKLASGHALTQKA
jgi:hypothetical protein